MKECLDPRNALARHYLGQKLGMLPDAVQAIADKDLLSAIATRLGGGATPRDGLSALWSAYHPWVIWLILGAVGLASLAGMVALCRRSPARA